MLFNIISDSKLDKIHELIDSIVRYITVVEF